MELKQIPITWKAKKWRDHVKRTREHLQNSGFSHEYIEEIILVMETEKKKWDEKLK